MKAGYKIIKPQAWEGNKGKAVLAKLANSAKAYAGFHSMKLTRSIATPHGCVPTSILSGCPNNNNNNKLY